MQLKSYILHAQAIIYILLELGGANHILNGDFSSPVVTSTSMTSMTSIPSWTGIFDIVGTDFFRSMGTLQGQYADLATTYNGYIEQTFSAPATD